MPKVELLDGNELREWLSSELGFEVEDRSAPAMRVAKLAKLLVGHNMMWFSCNALWRRWPPGIKRICTA